MATSTSFPSLHFSPSSLFSSSSFFSLSLRPGSVLGPGVGQGGLADASSVLDNPWSGTPPATSTSTSSRVDARLQNGATVTDEAKAIQALKESWRLLEEEHFESAQTSASQAAALFQAAEDDEGAGEAQRLVVGCMLHQGRLADANAHLKEQLEAFDGRGSKLGLALLRLCKADLAAWEGDVAAGLEALDQLQAALPALQDKRLDAAAALARARLLIRGERLVKALEECRGARRLAEAQDDKLYQALSSRLESSILLLGEADVKGALAASSAALALFRSLGRKKEVALELLQLSRIDLLRRKWEAALAPLAEAEFLLESLQNPSFEGLNSVLHVKVQALLGKRATQAATQAVERRRAALRAAGRSNSALEVALLADAQVHILLAEGRRPDALKACELALDLARSLAMASPRLEAGVLCNLALLRWLGGDPSEAADLTQQALQIQQDLGDSAQAGAMTYRLALMRHQQGSHADSLILALQAKSLFQKAQRRSSSIAASLLEADLRQVGDDVDAAERLLNESLLAAQEALDGRTEAATYLGFASLLCFGKNQDASRFSSGLVALEKAETLLRARPGEERLLADALYSKCLALAALADLEGALSAAQEAQLLFQTVEDDHGLAESLRTGAALELELVHQGGPAVLKSNPKALTRAKASALRQAESAVHTTRRATADKRALASALHVLAQALNANGAAKRGLEAAQEAERLCNEIQDRPGEAQALVVAADSCVIANDRQMAAGYAEQASLLFRALGDADGDALAQSVLAAQIGHGTEVKSGQKPELQEESQPTEQQPKPEAKLVALNFDLALTMARDAALQAMGVDEDIEEDVPLMDAGLDSLAAISFRELLMSSSGLKLPSSLVFDYPSLTTISQFLMEASSDPDMKL